MKKSLLLIFLAAIVLAGCSMSTTPKSTMTTDQLFQKKQECAQYKDKIEKELAEQTDKENGKYMILKEIFYSPKANSCLYYANWWFTASEGFIELNWVIDYLSDEMILNTPNFCNEWKMTYTSTNCFDERFKFDTKLKEIKWK